MPTRRATTSTTEIVLEAADEALAVRGRVGLVFGVLMMATSSARVPDLYDHEENILHVSG